MDCVIVNPLLKIRKLFLVPKKENFHIYRLNNLTAIFSVLTVLLI